MARKVLIQILNGLEMNIGTLNPGELAYCTDTQKLYIGSSKGNVLLVVAQTAGDMLKSIYDTDNDGIVDAAEKAIKLQTPRTITLTGDVTGGTSFDGSGNVSIITANRKIAFVGSDSAASNGWYKVATQTMQDYGNTNLMFAVASTYGYYNSGILELQVRSDNTSISCKTLKWNSRTGFDVAHFIVVVSGMTWALYAYQPSSQYGRIAFEILSQSSSSGKDQGWVLTFTDNSTKESVTPTATIVSSDGSTVLSAAKLRTARKLSLSGNVTGSIAFDGSTDVSIPVKVAGPITWGQLKGV